MKKVDFSETIEACDLKVGRYRQLIDFMKVKVISLPYIFQVFYVLCFTRPQYQVSVYRTIGPLVKMVFGASLIWHSHSWARLSSLTSCPSASI